MAQTAVTHRIVPVALGVGMLALVVAAGLSPNAGAVPAQSYCQYNQCVAGTGIPWWALAAIAIVVVAALLGALLFMRRGRRPPSQPVQPYAGPPSGATGAAAAAAPSGPTGPAATPEYVESPSDVSAPPPVVPTSPPAGGGTPPKAAAPAGTAPAKPATGEPDIDSLMAELDKISTEILKRPKPPAGGASGGGGSGGSAGGSS